MPKFNSEGWGGALFVPAFSVGYKAEFRLSALISCTINWCLNGFAELTIINTNLFSFLRVRLIHALGVHLLGFYKVIQKFSFTLFFCVLSSRKVRIVRNSGFYPLLVNKQILVAIFSRDCQEL